ncbi:MAG: helix-turn-helix transcriptional regulator [Tepidisphaeraceae bacterium]
MPAVADYDTIDPLMFREAIIAARDKRGWSTNHLAKEAGVPQSRLSDFLAGKRDLHSGKVEKLLTVLGIDLTHPKASKPSPSKRKGG